MKIKKELDNTRYVNEINTAMAIIGLDFKDLIDKVVVVKLSWYDILVVIHTCKSKELIGLDGCNLKHIARRLFMNIDTGIDVEIQDSKLIDYFNKP